MNNDIVALRAEVASLRAAQDQDKLARRLAERDDEYRRRIQMMDHAASGVAPDGHPENTPLPGGDAYHELLSKVDLEKVKCCVTDVHEKGYCVVPDLLSADEVDRVREGLAPLFEGCRSLFEATGRGQTMHVQNVLAKTTVADAVAINPMLRAVVSGILTHDFVLNAGVVAMSPDPGCQPQGLHRDDGFFTQIPRPHMPLIVTAAIALDDFYQANGATQLVPGSSGWSSSRQPKPDEKTYGEMSAGSVLLWDGAVLHGGGGNDTETSRRTLTLNYARAWLRTQFNQYLSIPRDRVLGMPSELQTDLGYHHSANGLGGCDTQDPLKYLQRLQDKGGDGHQHLLGREQKTP